MSNKVNKESFPEIVFLENFSCSGNTLLNIHLGQILVIYCTLGLDFSQNIFRFHLSIAITGSHTIVFREFPQSDGESIQEIKLKNSAIFIHWHKVASLKPDWQKMKGPPGTPTWPSREKKY